MARTMRFRSSAFMAYLHISLPRESHLPVR
jgi:hypothetical protein